MRRRVLILTPWFPDRSASTDSLRMAGVFVREQALAVARHHDVAVVHVQDHLRPDRGLVSVTEDTDAGLPVLRVRQAVPAATRLRSAGQLAGVAAAVRRLRRRGWHPDVLHAHVFPVGLTAVVLGRLLRRPVVVTEHFSGFANGGVRGADRLLAKVAFERADLVTPVSEFLRRHIEALGIRGTFRVVPNVVDTAVFRPGGRGGPDAPARLIVVAMLNELKGHRHLLDALPAVRERVAVTLDIVGDGPCRAALERRARDLHVDDIVTFRGARPKPEVAALLRESDVFVLPSLIETLGCVVIEALASGLPVVATDVGGIPEIVDERDGILVPPAQPAALADALVEMVARRAALDPAAIAARAASRFSFEAVGATWDEVYARLGRPTPAR
jgi:glycosyltransferase involved in cell wall biosynthesis